MNEEYQIMIKRYIVYPMAIQVLQQDFESFRYFEIGKLYMSLVESIMKRLREDFYNLKSELYSKHHIDIKRLGKGKYKANNEVYEFSPEELKDLTRDLISEYLMKTREFEIKSIPWNSKEEKWE